jgi:hypothetical protein
MSYWILPESGIPVSASTVQRLTNDERNTDETKKRMDECDDKVKVIFEAQTADMTNRLHDIETSKVIDHECEDPDFFDAFTRVIGIRLTVTYFSSSYDTLLKDLVENLARSGSYSRWEFRFLSSTYYFNPFTTPALPALNLNLNSCTCSRT